MENLAKLINEKCSWKAKYKKIGEICKISRGVVMSKDFVRENAGDFPVYSSQTENNGELGRINSYMYDGEFLTWTTDGANAGSIFYRNGKFNITNVCGLLDLIDKSVDIRYLFYVLQTNAKSYVSKGMGNPKLMSNVMSTISIPIPPLEIQKEIVAALDEFTDVSNQLLTKLLEEKQLRQTQYNFYRDAIFNPDFAGIKWLPLKDCIESLRTGLNPRQNFKLNIEGANCPYITGKDIFNNKVNTTDRTDMISEEVVRLINRRARLEDDMLLFASTGTGTVGRMAVVDKYDGKWNVSETLYCIKLKKTFLTKFMMHYLYSNVAVDQFGPKISKGSVPHLTVSDLLEVKVPCFSIEDQKRIISNIEEYFSENSHLIERLTAEYENRKKQYDFYRKSLLSFEELKA